MRVKECFGYLLLACLLILIIAQPIWGGKKKGKKGKGKKPKSPPVKYNKTTCTKVMMPMCRNLILYTNTQLTHKKKGQLMNQGQLSTLIEPMWAFMDTECSPQFREMVCGYYLPKCDSKTGKPLLPCRSVCRLAKRGCSGLFKAQKRKWPTQFKCNKLPLKKCVPPSSLRHIPSIQVTGTRCVPNTIPMCNNLTGNTTDEKEYVYGFLPNMFLQNSQARIIMEVNNYNELLETGCSPHLAFFICGVYLPYCIVQDGGSEGFRVPCREVCEEVYNNCQKEIRLIFKSQWPSKFQCHRYPSKEGPSNRLQCLEPSEMDIVRKVTPPA